MTDLRGSSMEVQNERTALIKTRDWSPDCGAGCVPYDGNFNARPSIEQNALIFTVIASYFITFACQLLYSPAF